MKSIEKNIESIKQFNYKIKLLKWLSLDINQINRINKLIKTNCFTINDLIRNLYIYKRKIIAILKKHINFTEELIKENNSYFIETTFLSKWASIMVVHSPIKWNINKYLKKVVKYNIKSKSEFYNRTLSKKEILKTTRILNIENIINKEWILVKNRKIRQIKDKNKEYHFFMRSIYFLHQFNNAYKLF